MADLDLVRFGRISPDENPSITLLGEYDAPYTGRFNHAMVSHEGYLYVIGGAKRADNSNLGDVWRTTDPISGWDEITSSAAFNGSGSVSSWANGLKAVSFNGAIYLFRIDEIWRSIDGGLSWEYVGLNPLNLGSGRYSVAVHGDHIYLIHPDYGIVWRMSKNHIWSERGSAMVGHEWWSTIPAIFSWAGYLWVVHGERVFISDDGGLSWAVMGGGNVLPEAVGYWFTVIPTGEGLFLLRSPCGAPWWTQNYPPNLSDHDLQIWFSADGATWAVLDKKVWGAFAAFVHRWGFAAALHQGRIYFSGGYSTYAIGSYLYGKWCASDLWRISLPWVEVAASGATSIKGWVDPPPPDNPSNDQIPAHGVNLLNFTSQKNNPYYISVSHRILRVLGPIYSGGVSQYSRVARYVSVFLPGVDDPRFVGQWGHLTEGDNWAGSGFGAVLDVGASLSSYLHRLVDPPSGMTRYNDPESYFIDGDPAGQSYYAQATISISGDIGPGLGDPYPAGPIPDPRSRRRRAAWVAGAGGRFSGALDGDMRRI